MNYDDYFFYGSEHSDRSLTTDWNLVNNDPADVAGTRLLAEAHLKARALIRDARVIEQAPWTFTAEDEDLILGDGSEERWNLYQQAHLGLDARYEPGSKARHRYPYAKLEGDKLVLYRSALNFIHNRAQANGDRAIERAARQLINQIQDREVVTDMAGKVYPHRLLEDQPAPLEAGDFVHWIDNGQRCCGRVVEARTEGLLEADDSSPLVGTKDDPALRIAMYREAGNGWTKSGTNCTVPASSANKILPLAPPRKVMSGRWFEMKAEDSEQTLYIYGDIGGFDEFSALEMIRQHEGMEGPLSLRINSYGGDVYEALPAVYALMRYPGEITAYIDGICASAATLFTIPAKTVSMPQNATFMIHRPETFAMGNLRSLESAAESLRVTEKNVVSLYSARTGKTPEVLNELMDKERWMGGGEAKQMGFVDVVTDEVQIAANARLTNEVINRYNFHNVPDSIRQSASAKPRLNKLDHLLTQMGTTRIQANRIPQGGS